MSARPSGSGLKDSEDLLQVTHLRTELEKTRECIVCMDKERRQAVQPCGHFAYCEQCVVEIVAGGVCSVCQQPVEGSAAVFL